ncbi:hypothetical protein CHH70_01030 [Shouchella clausii]|nr:hypothetical protein CHH70_01030 [Shouchella clausii]
MFLARLFNGIDRQYLVKSYIISIVCTFLFWQIQDGNQSLGLIIFCGINLVLFPFATVVWDDFISLMTGGISIELPLLIFLMWKVFKIAILYVFTIIIAPLGIIYVLIANKLGNRQR